MDDDGEIGNTPRGVKREGVTGDGDAAPLAKKARQTGTRRARNP